MSLLECSHDQITFDPDSRYARQIVLPEIGLKGQRRLYRSSVLIIGCGALGCIHAQLLARAGVGRIIIADRDVPALHNLQRQFLFDEDDVAAKIPKATAAARKLKRVNSSIKIEAIVTDVTAENIERLIEAADVILDGTDNFETRFLINDVCIKHAKPWIYGGVEGTTGMVLTIYPGRGPCFRCLLPEMPDPATLPTCDTHGVLNTVIVWTASLQVTEAFKLLLGDTRTAYQFYLFDLWKINFRPVPVKRNLNCTACVQRSFEYLEADTTQRTTILCGRNATQISPPRLQNLSLDVLAEKLRRTGPVSVNGQVIEFQTKKHRMIIFPDGRVIVKGTTNPAVARSLVARCLGA